MQDIQLPRVSEILKTVSLLRFQVSTYIYFRTATQTFIHLSLSISISVPYTSLKLLKT